MTAEFLRHPLLAECGVPHGFGVRGVDAPADLFRPRQVHGTEIVSVEECAGGEAPVADGVVSSAPNRPVGVITADCVPILLSARSGDAVAAIHAGWRGLAAGVVAEGVARLREVAGKQTLAAVIGPHIGLCCYEVDLPVTDAMRARFGADLGDAEIRVRPGHSRIDLGRLAHADLLAAGIESGSIGALRDTCTRCDSERFHSYRRDGAAAGRLIHFVAARMSEP